MTHDPHVLPDDLPVPTDDGACDHLERTTMPGVALPSTDGSLVGLRLPGTAVFFVYPKSGRPGVDPPPGWTDTPGMRGCTPQTCAFRDRAAQFASLGVTLFGVSTQTTDDQQEFAGRLELPFPLLSDAGCVLESELGIPAVDVTGTTLRVYRRATLISVDGVIEKVFYPVFPPDANADEVLAWLHAR
jgi:peroxiredoxin